MLQPSLQPLESCPTAMGEMVSYRRKTLTLSLGPAALAGHLIFAAQEERSTEMQQRRRLQACPCPRQQPPSCPEPYGPWDGGGGGGGAGDCWGLGVALDLQYSSLWCM